ncbi:valine--pyruvate transaminase [Salinispira pacifica]
MRYSLFGEKLSARSGILELMQDLGEALESPGRVHMLGGGNPAHLPEVNAVWRRRMSEILANRDEFEHMVADYDSPRGKEAFLTSVATLLRREYGWDIGPENVAVTNGSQSAFFYLFNMFAGPYADGVDRQILCPVVPEYIGYADQGARSGMFRGAIPQIEERGAHSFKYRVDFDRVETDERVAAICVSRPTNPTGNVLTDDEVSHLAAIAEDAGIPLLVDNAYGMPFPGIIFTDAAPVWRPNIVLSMSLSKLGLPSVRTGIIVADSDITSRLSGVNAVVSLANGSLGQVLTRPMFDDGSILSLSRDVIRPFYRARAERAQAAVAEAFGNDIDYAVHTVEGSIFLWIWFRALSISTRELYARLKRRGVIVVPGEYFFFGIEEEWEHSRQCIRVNYCHDEGAFREGIAVIAEEARHASR